MVSKKIAVVGTPDTILPFKAIGADGYEALDAGKALEQLRTVVRNSSYGIIYLEELFADELSVELEELGATYRGVSITAIAGAKGSSGKSMERIRAHVKRAIGIDIFADKGGN